MRFQWDEELKTIFGGGIRFAENKATETLRTVSLTAVLNQEVIKTDGAAKYAAYEFAKKIKEADEETEFSIDEIAQLKQAIGSMESFGPVIIGPVFDALEGK